MRTRTRVLVVLPLVLALAGCGGSDPDPDPEPATTSDGSDTADEGAASDAEDTSLEEEPVEASDDGGSEDAAGNGDCPDGPREIDGVSMMTFLCGSATASVTTSDGTWSLAGGSCEAREDSFAVNFGTVVLDAGAVVDGTAPEVDYLGIAVHEGAGGDGTYDDFDMVTVVTSMAGEEYAAGTGTVTLRDGRTAGDASADGVTIEFDCG